MKFSIITIFLLMSNIAIAQLVNIESKRMQTDSIRFVLKNDFSFKYTNNNGKYISQFNNALSTQAKSKDLRKIYFLLGNYHLIRTANQDFRNSWFLHLRFNYKLTDLFRIESYIQGQNNELLDINERYLAGTGIRFKLIGREHLRMYLATAYLYEEEISDELDQQNFNHRNSSYFSITASSPNDKIILINTAYFQPLFKDFNDYTFLDQLKIELKINKQIHVFGIGSYYYDNITPRERAQYSTDIRFGFGLKL